MQAVLLNYILSLTIVYEAVERTLEVSLDESTTFFPIP